MGSRPASAASFIRSTELSAWKRSITRILLTIRTFPPPFCAQERRSRARPSSPSPQNSSELSRRFGFNARVIAPKPPQRVGQNGAAMFAVVTFRAELEFIIISGKFQRCRHLLVGQRPIPVEVVQVFRAVLQEYPDRLLFRLADQSRIHMASANVSEASDVAEHFAKSIRAFPCHRPGANSPRTD